MRPRSLAPSTATRKVPLFQPQGTAALRWYNHACGQPARGGQEEAEGSGHDGLAGSDRSSKRRVLVVAPGTRYPYGRSQSG